LPTHLLLQFLDPAFLVSNTAAANGTMQSDIYEREHYDFFRLLWKEMANDAAVAAKIGDFCGVLAGLHYVGDLVGAQLRDHLRRQFIVEWQRRLERGDELTSFLALQGLAPATSLVVADDERADPARPSSRP
jgi:hypothetical protein